MTTQADQSSYEDHLLTSDVDTDGFGRTVMSHLSAPEGEITNQTSFDALGRIQYSYNPAVGAPSVFTRYTYDGMGRIATVTYPDGSVETSKSTDSSNNLLGYNTVEYTDAAGKVRREQTDGLGRIIQVTEDPYGQNLVTTYTYDVQDDLISVTQGSQTRTFAYDSLKQLRSVVNPESGALVSCNGVTGNVSVCYTYDNDGNLSTKTVAGTQSGTLQVTYSYDALERLTERTYSDGTPTATYCYDGMIWSQTAGGCSGSAGAPSIGHLTQSGSTVSSTAYSYDVLGRIASSTQHTNGQSYLPFYYSYNLAGALTQQTYPSGRKVGYQYDSAGRTERVANGPLTSPFSYATGLSYAPQGSIHTVTLGNEVVQTTNYNSRLQIQSITAAKSGTLLGLSYTYPSGNNGSLSSQQIHYDSIGSETALTVTQNYSPYDAMNRLGGFGEGSVSQSYNHDRYGNHWVQSNSGYQLNSWTPTGATAFNTANNRLTAQSYDNRGNQTSLSPYTMAYDGDDHQISATSANESASYQYDSDGNRVVKMTCSNPTPCTASSSSLVTTIYLYDAMGQLAAEYSTQPASGGTEYYTSDHLGSTRLVTDPNGAVKQRYDYLPFGEELFAGMNGRSSFYPAAPPSTPPQGGMLYTGQLRDSETSLDFFQARYFWGPQARFTGADGPFNDQDASDPQSWNLYTYVRNDPLNGTDPSGEYQCGTACNSPAPAPGGAAPGASYDPSVWRVLYGIFSGASSVVQQAQQVQQFAQAGIDWIRRANWNCVGTAGASLAGGAATGFMAGSGAAVLTGPGAPAAALPFALVGSVGFGTTAFVGSFSMCTTGGGGSPTPRRSPGVSNKINHIFNEPEHNLDILIQRYGSKEGAYDALEEATTLHVKSRGLSGEFEEVVNVGGSSVTVRGAVVNGVVRIGTAFIP